MLSDGGGRSSSLFKLIVTRFRPLIDVCEVIDASLPAAMLDWPRLIVPPYRGRPLSRISPGCDCFRIGCYDWSTIDFPNHYSSIQGVTNSMH